MKFYASILFSVILIGCSGPVPKGIINQEEIQAIIYDLMQTDEYLSTQLNDTAINEKMQRSIYYEQVFRLHNTTRKSFYSSYQFYQKRPDLHKKIFENISDSILRKLADTTSRKNIKQIK